MNVTISIYFVGTNLPGNFNFMQIHKIELESISCILICIVLDSLGTYKERTEEDERHKVGDCNITTTVRCIFVD